MVLKGLAGLAASEPVVGLGTRAREAMPTLVVAVVVVILAVVVVAVVTVLAVVVVVVVPATQTTRSTPRLHRSRVVTQGMGPSQSCPVFP